LNKVEEDLRMIKVINTMEEAEYEGEWWIPENPDKKISGTLRFSPINGSNLKLNGLFKELKDLNVFLHPNIILGKTSNSGHITLYKCCEHYSRAHTLGSLSSSFTADVVFIGHHFCKEEDIVFSSLSLTYPHLEEWIGISGIKIDMKPDLVIIYGKPRKIEAEIDDIHICINPNCELKVNRISFRDEIKECNLKQTISIDIKPPGQIHFNDYMRNICHHIQNFLSLAIGEAVYPLTIKGKNEAYKSEALNRVLYDDIPILYPIGRSSNTAKELRPDDMLFSFEDISDNFEKYLNNWFARSEVLSPACNLYFGTIYEKSMNLEHRFLNLIKAIESYHRRAHDGKYMSDDDYLQIYKKLIEAIPKDTEENLSESLKQRLMYHNEFSLRKRLKEVIDMCGDATNLLIHNNKRFIENVVEMRNFLTHYTKDLERRTQKDKELAYLFLQTKFIMEICLLIELGIPMEKIRPLISRNRRYQQLGEIL
jgi:hypothetical protein